jgi:hypothetical protein
MLTYLISVNHNANSKLDKVENQYQIFKLRNLKNMLFSYIFTRSADYN